MLDTDKETQILDLFQDVKPLSDYVSSGLKKVKKTMSHLSSSNDSLPETFLKVQLTQLQEHDFNEEIYPTHDDSVTVRQVMESILTNGFDGVITCTKGEKDRYIIVSGHIRFRALTQLVKEGHLQFNEVMISLKEFKSNQDEMMYIMDMNNAKRQLNDIHRFRSIGIYLKIYRSNPDSDLSKRSEIQFLCDKLNLSERQIYKYLSIYKENDGDIEKAINLINQHGSVNKTAQFIEKNKLKSINKLINKNKVKTILDLKIDRNVFIPLLGKINLDLRMDIIVFLIEKLTRNIALYCEQSLHESKFQDLECLDVNRIFIRGLLYDFRDNIINIQHVIKDKKNYGEAMQLETIVIDDISKVNRTYFPDPPYESEKNGEESEDE